MNNKKLILIPLLGIMLFAAGCSDTQSENKLQKPNTSSSSNKNISSSAKNVTEDKTPQPTQPTKKIIVGNESLAVEVVNDDAHREMGLSYRASLAEGTGMLFDFTNTKEITPAFWMKGMNFALDIIWIYKDHVVSISKNVPVPSDDGKLPTYSPAGTITHVLEVPAGWSDAHKVKTDSPVQL